MRLQRKHNERLVKTRMYTRKRYKADDRDIKFNIEVRQDEKKKQD